MSTATISKKLGQNNKMIVISRKEHETLVGLKKIKEFSPTISQKKALVKAEQNLNHSKTLSYNQLVRKLGFTN